MVPASQEKPDYSSFCLKPCERGSYVFGFPYVLIGQFPPLPLRSLNEGQYNFQFQLGPFFPIIDTNKTKII